MPVLKAHMIRRWQDADLRLLLTTAALRLLDVGEVRSQVPGQSAHDATLCVIGDGQPYGESRRRHGMEQSNGQGALRNATRVGRCVVAGLSAASAAVFRDFGID